MSTAAVSRLSILQELQGFYQTRGTDLKQLGTALQSGDLAAAQQAYSALQALGQSGPFSSAEPFSKASRAQAFEAVGQALQSGDLAEAQSAFAALTSKTNNSAPTTDATPAAIVKISNSQASAAAPTSSSIFQQLQAFQQQRRSDVAQLGQDLQSGNLSAAQSDFSALTALGQSGPYKNGATFVAANRAQDFQAIGQGLQSGDITGAQSAFANLSSTFGKQNQQAQNAISAYNSGITEVVINFNTTPAGTGTTSAGATSGTTIFAGPPVQAQPPIATPVETPVTQPPTTGTPEIVIILGGASGAGSPSGTQPELIINLGQSSGSPSGNLTEIDINFGGAPSAGSTSASTPEILINLPSSSSSAASPGGVGEQVTINLGNSNSGAEISIAAPQSRSSSPSQNSTPSEQVTLNLGKNANYELILNLLNSSSGQSQIGSGSPVSLQA
jgi:hypothetical protein